ncbi:MAG: TolC family protein, partial [Prevotellaceae bacterium]|jgi:outer membrane protein|nr:TolC family protein [Prevotellaceae bacterium]
MKKTLACTAAMLLCCHAAVHAQAWTLERCIEHAIANNLSIKMEAINHEARVIDLHTAKHSRLPNFSAGVDQSFSFGSVEDTRGAISNQKMSSNTSFSVSSNMPLFTGFQIANEVKVRRYSVQAAKESLNRAKENIAVAVARAFLDVLLKKEIYKISEETMRFTSENVKKTEIMVGAGNVPLAQLYEIKSQQASDEARLTSAGNDVSLSLLTLGQLLELSDLSRLDVEVPGGLDSAARVMEEDIPSSEKIYSKALAVKPQIREAELQLEGSKFSLKVAEAGYYPQLSLSMGLSDRYFRANDAIIPSEGFSTQLGDNLQEYVGLSLRIPVFNRFATKNSVRTAQINISSRQLALEDVKKTLYKEIQQAYHSAVAAQKSYRAAQKSVEAAREAFRYAESKYQTGKSSVYELTEAQTTLTRSLSEESQAKFSYIFAAKILDFYSGKPIAL